MINIKEIWNMTLKCIEDKIPQKIYENYFDDVKLLSLDKNIATVVVPVSYTHLTLPTIA